MAATKTLYWAHGGDASKADRAWAKRLTADPRSLLLTVLNKYLFNLIYFSNNLLFCEEAWCCEQIYHKSRPAQIRSVGPVKNRDRTLKELFHT